jgi:hypothetical protein
VSEPVGSEARRALQYTAHFEDVGQRKLLDDEAAASREIK